MLKFLSSNLRRSEGLSIPKKYEVYGDISFHNVTIEQGLVFTYPVYPRAGFSSAFGRCIDTELTSMIILAIMVPHILVLFKVDLSFMES